MENYKIEEFKVTVTDGKMVVEYIISADDENKAALRAGVLMCRIKNVDRDNIDLVEVKPYKMVLEG
jgi:hypothetical protein